MEWIVDVVGAGVVVAGTLGDVVVAQRA